MENPVTTIVTTVQTEPDDEEGWNTPTLIFDRNSVSALRDGVPSWDVTTTVMNLQPGGRYHKYLYDHHTVFTIERVLAEGGTAIIYLAYDDAGRAVAIKEIKLPHELLHHEENGLARFIREARVMGQLHHPNIVPILGQWHSPFRYWLIMPYIGGGTLYHRLHPTTDTFTQLPVPLACAYLLQILDALRVAHSQRIPVIHRDLKPLNILLDDKEPDHLLIADWGSAHEINIHLTQNGTAIGTPTFMAPEQLLRRAPDGPDPIGPWTDIYACGVILFEMLAGVPPFMGNTESVVHSHLYEPPPIELLCQQNRQVNHFLCECILTALQKSPTERFQSAEEFAEAIGIFVE